MFLQPRLQSPFGLPVVDLDSTSGQGEGDRDDEEMRLRREDAGDAGNRDLREAEGRPYSHPGEQAES